MRPNMLMLCIFALLIPGTTVVSASDKSLDVLMEKVKIRYPDGVGRWTELFLDDDYLVESSKNIKVVPAKATKLVTSQVLKSDKPWELDSIGYTNVIYDKEENLYKMWYSVRTTFHPYESAGGVPGTELSLCYAVSKDGLAWEKPLLNAVYSKGQRTNIVFSGVSDMPAGAYYVIKDYNDPDPGRRYKMLYNFWDFQGRGLGIAWSADGIHWQAPLPYTLIQGGFDTHNIVFWDAKYGCWVAYTRRWQYGKRFISRATSPDLFHWSNDVTIEGPDMNDGPDDNLYTPACFQLRDVRYAYIMVTGVFNDVKDTVIPQMAVSRDGLKWSRFRQPFIQPGNKGEWDSAGGYPLATEVPKGDQMLFYYVGTTGAHSPDPNKGIGVAAIQKDRYVGLTAGEEDGQITTHLLALTHLDGRHADRGVLEVNAQAEGGSVAVELLDANGKVIPGFSRKECIAVTGDQLNHLIRWKNQPTLFPVIGEPVKMRFYLKNATIYGFTVLHRDPELKK